MAYNPIKVEVLAGQKVVSPLNKKHTYTADKDGFVYWCTCDKSKIHPHCDGNHNK